MARDTSDESEDELDTNDEYFLNQNGGKITQEVFFSFSAHLVSQKEKIT